MKNINIFLALAIITGSTFIIESRDLKPYVTGTGRDENGRNILHMMALNCHRGDRFLSEIEEKRNLLEKDGVEIRPYENIGYLIEKDNEGNFPSAYIMKSENKEGIIEWHLFKLIQYSDCRDLFSDLSQFEYHKKMNEEKN